MEGVSQPVVIDNGSGIIKAGLAGTSAPVSVFPNYLGVPKRNHTRVMKDGRGELDQEIFVGPKAEQHRGILTLRYPVKCGSVTDWTDMEKTWDYLYGKDQLNVHREEHPVLLTEVPFETLAAREKSAEIFFESFNVPGLHFALQAVLSLYATGRTTGVVCDSGDGVTQAVPIYQGFAIEHCKSKTDIAGREVTEFLKKLLRDENRGCTKGVPPRGPTFLTEFEVVKDIKEQSCFVRPLPEDNEPHEPAEYRLPDGHTLEIHSSRYRAPEVLFKPYLIGDESPGIHELLHEAIDQADIDLRRTLRQNIVISGGTSLLPGFNIRLLNELKNKAPNDVKIRLSVPKERLYSTWIGGSILACLDCFRQTMVTKNEYLEQGPRVLQKYCS